MTDADYMQLALNEAQKAAQADEVPVGCVVVTESGEVISAAYNTGEHGTDAMEHAELKAMREAAVKLGQPRLWNCVLYVTLEPCAMCAAGISMMRLKRVVFGADNPKGGAVINGVKYFESATCNHKPEVVSGVLAEECGEILSTFFKNKR